MTDFSTTESADASQAPAPSLVFQAEGGIAPADADAVIEEVLAEAVVEAVVDEVVMEAVIDEVEADGDETEQPVQDRQVRRLPGPVGKGFAGDTQKP